MASMDEWLAVSASLADSAARNAIAVGESNAARKWQEKMDQLNYERELEAREYNTPSNQMQRYIAAGLNPNLVSGVGNTPASNPGTPTTPVRMQIPEGGFSNAFQMVQAAKLNQAQIDNIQSQTQRNLAQVKYSEQMTRLKNLDELLNSARNFSYITRGKFDYDVALQVASLFEKEVNAGLRNEELAFNLETHDTRKLTENLRNGVLEKTIDNLASQARLADSKSLNLSHQNNLLDARTIYTNLLSDFERMSQHWRLDILESNSYDKKNDLRLQSLLIKKMEHELQTMPVNQAMKFLELLLKAL